jgi:transcriptional regulator
MAGAKLWRMIKTTRKNISAAARRARSNMMSHKLLQGPVASYSL